MSGGGLVCPGGAPPGHLSGGGSALLGGCPGGVRGAPPGCPGTPVRGAPPDTPQTSGTPPGQGIAGFARPRLPKHPSIFSSTVSIFEAFCVACRVCFSARSRADFHTSRDRFQLFEVLCSSINSERVIEYELCYIRRPRSASCAQRQRFRRRTSLMPAKS